MSSFLQAYIPLGIFISHIVWVALILAVIFRKSWGRAVVGWIGKYAVPLGFSVVLASFFGSLFYSEVVGFPPCALCWWQRVFIYPQVVLFASALWKGRSDVFTYAVPLSALSAVVSLYQQYVYMGGGSILPCTSEGGACEKIYVLAYGYITIPMMSLTAALLILLIAYMRKIHENCHS